MKCLVTGVSGFVGGHVLRHLSKSGHEVRGFYRKGADLSAISDVSFEHYVGDLTDEASVNSAVEGCEWVFHVGAAYSLWMKDYQPMYDANVGGTRNILEASKLFDCQMLTANSMLFH